MYDIYVAIAVHVSSYVVEYKCRQWNSYHVHGS